MTLDPTVVIAALGGLLTAVGAAVRIVYMDLRRDRDHWRDMALAALGVNDKAIRVAEKAARDA